MADREWMVRRFTMRSQRLLRFCEMIAEGIAVPEVIISGECDLVRDAVESIEKEFVTDPEAVKKLRQETKDEMDREIEAAGGIDAWSQKIELEYSDPEGSA